MTKSKHIIIHDPIKRFWSWVDRRSDGECWEWIGKERSKEGYGRIKIKNKHFQAHRFSYVLAYSPIPDGMLVCHRCDNPPCVNPAHLFLGTNADNAADRDKKGRKALGERNGKSKLLLQDVVQIKMLVRDKVSDCEIGRRFGVRSHTILAIRRGWSWKWVN